MRAINFESLFSSTVRFLIPIVFLYVVSMFVFPWSQGDWAHVQTVWDRWQALNVGMLAFVSSLIAFASAQYKDKKQKERQFIAARAFLPHALSGLTTYFKRSAAALVAMSERTEGQTLPALPSLPADFKEIFSDCIQFADAEVGSFLAKILADLQVHQARLTELLTPETAGYQFVFVHHSLLSYAFSLGTLQARVNNLFDFARGEAEFENQTLTWDDVRNAYANLDLHLAEIEGLEAFTKKRISSD